MPTNQPSSIKISLAATPPERDTLSVSQLNRRAKMLLETQLPLLWIEGEISNFSRPASGHWYFTLKDSSAQVRCAMFKGRNSRAKFEPQQGQQVTLRARVSLYEGRGDYQLIAEYIEETGSGALERAFETLKQQLNDEGLFAAEHKQTLPEYPQRVALITSPSGAAVRDIISVFARRYPLTELVILPVLVQGVDAPRQIVRALQIANRMRAIDAIILGRGGGSLEDLWAFNDETLARTISHSKVPVISAVGHETDFTIADFVADHRAPTPSAAAEILSPDGEELLSAFDGFQALIEEAIWRKLEQFERHLKHLQARLRHPGDRLNSWSQQLDGLEIRLTQSIQNNLNKGQHRLQQLTLRQSQYHPQTQLHELQQQLTHLQRRLRHELNTHLQQQKQRLGKACQLLNTVSPLNTLERGYALVTDSNGRILTRAQDVKKGDLLETQLAQGKLRSIVTDCGMKKSTD